MTRFYLRWAIVLIIGAVIAGLTVQRYRSEIQAISPQELLESLPSGSVRVLGQVEAGSLKAEGRLTDAAFTLAHQDVRIQVLYEGPEPDNLRELKNLVAVGRWDPGQAALIAHEIDLVPNFGFVGAAYLATLIPLILFLFVMERRVNLLYNAIKQAKAYESEANPVE